MSIYSSFFTPQTISILLCLHQSTKQAEQVDAKNPIVQFLIKKILKLTQESNTQLTNEGFEAEMFSVINDMEFLQKYRQNLTQLDSFNNFYRQISNILKTLRSLRNSKLEQGNVVDFLIRRLYIYFQKLDFKQIVGIYENFSSYRQNQPYKMRQNEFMLTKSIQEVKFNLQNYPLKENPEEINKILQKLAQNDHTFKTSYVKGLYRAQENKPNESLHELHRYFDRCLGNLFQQKTQTTPMSNKINHCILSIAYSYLKLGYLQECLQSISEGLRISQNNNDEQSINNCIIYLYKIAEQLGKYQQQILLTEHAITHSLNLSNIVLMVYSCLCYSIFQKKYNCQNTEVALLKSRSINWTDALHFAKKKVYSNFQSNCKNIYHSFRSLLIPTFLHKLAILVHIPQLQKLLINPYYSREELFDLQVYKEFQGNNTLVDKQLKTAKRYFNLNQRTLLQRSVEKLRNLEKQSKAPENIIKIKKFLCMLEGQSGVQMESYKSVEELLFTCQKYGFVKSYIVDCFNFINKLLLKNQLYFDSLVKIQQTITFCQQNALFEQRIVSDLLKSQGLAQIGSIFDSLEILRKIQEQGMLKKLPNESVCLFWQTKMLVSRKAIAGLQKDIDFLSQINQIKKGQVEGINNMIACCITEGNLQKIRKVLKQFQNFIVLNPLVVQNKQACQQKIKKILTYLQKAEVMLKSLDKTSSSQQYDEQLIADKLLKKIHSLYF